MFTTLAGVATSHPTILFYAFRRAATGRQSGDTLTADGAVGGAASGPTAKHVRFAAGKRTQTAVPPPINHESHSARGPSGQRSPRIAFSAIGCAKRPECHNGTLHRICDEDGL